MTEKNPIKDFFKHPDFYISLGLIALATSGLIVFGLDYLSKNNLP